ncbi:hypothetical protein HPP92_012630 [Vanilla planifolia]|uniref:Uncharacterized protein n=1 Tax=Vanilla planifolia TaxID=51239 RepID=A0A835UY91_VANPL|nr:hypothetical protein HPP92_013042 [Vanilla planifolia]KAG0477911.1 hypothetical protein HPP92_012630 [Vanilla planifolia]
MKDCILEDTLCYNIFSMMLLCCAIFVEVYIYHVSYYAFVQLIDCIYLCMLINALRNTELILMKKELEETHFLGLYLTHERNIGFCKFCSCRTSKAEYEEDETQLISNKQSLSNKMLLLSF